jgi:uncharacterized protein HemX
MTGRLEGLGVVVTRPRAAAESLAQALAAEGARPIVFPSLAIEAPRDAEALERALGELAGASVAIFVSANAVEAGLARARAHGPWPAGLAVAAVGDATAEALRNSGFAEVISPPVRHDSEGLLELPELQSVRDKSIIVFRGEGGREKLKETLEARGARVTYAECYRRSRPEADPRLLLAALERGEVQAVSAHSAETLENFLALAGDAAAPHLARATLVVPHEAIARHPDARRFAQVRVASPGTQGLIETLSTLKASTPNMTEPSRTASPPPPRPARRQADGLARLLAFIALVATGAAGWIAVDARRGLEGLEATAGSRLGELGADSRKAGAALAQAQADLREAQSRVAQLEARMTEVQEQRVALEEMYRDISRSTDERLLAEVEQMLVIAGQQLQLAGNVRGALVALQAADQRLARAEKLAASPLRRAISQDIERLRGVPQLDTVGLAMKIDGLIGQVDALPLPFAETPPPNRATRVRAADDEGVTRVARDLWQEMKGLVRIRELDAPEPVLLAPSQAYFLRENLKLRLLAARVSLLARDESSFREDLKAAHAWMARYFDAKARPTATALATLKQVADAPIAAATPDINASLAAARAARAPREKR